MIKKYFLGTNKVQKRLENAISVSWKLFNTEALNHFIIW
jgi:hypothetical protein